MKSLSFPLAAPSANPFGYVSPTKPEHVNEQLGDKIPYILDGGNCEIGIESTIVGFEEDNPVVYRMGGLSIEAIEALDRQGKYTDPFYLLIPNHQGSCKVIMRQEKKSFIGKIEELLQEYPAHCSGLLTFQTDFNSPHQFILSPSGSLTEAAQNLFTALRAFDKMPIDVILAELVPDQGNRKSHQRQTEKGCSNRIMIASCDDTCT